MFMVADIVSLRGNGIRIGVFLIILQVNNILCLGGTMILSPIRSSIMLLEALLWSW